MGFELEFSGVTEFSKERCDVEESIENSTLYNSLSIGHIFPNPTRQSINITLESPLATKASFAIIDIYGKQLHLKKQELVKGKQQINLEVENLSPGTYFISINTNKETVQRKFIKI